MVKEAQNSKEPFYIDVNNENCFGAVTLGMRGTPPFTEVGMEGHALEIFKEPRANSRIYNYLPKIHLGKSTLSLGLNHIYKDMTIGFLIYANTKFIL